jgi:hypothetical protein
MALIKAMLDKESAIKELIKRANAKSICGHATVLVTASVAAPVAALSPAEQIG